MTVSKRSLPSSEELEGFRQVVEHSLDMVVIFDAEGVVQYVNSAFTRISGYASEDAVGKAVRGLGTIPTGVEEELNASIRDEGRWQGEWETARENGEPYWISTTISLLRDSAGRAIHLVAMSRDVTERRRAEEGLRQSEARFRALAELTPVSIFLIDGFHNIYVNPAAESITGYSRDELLAMDFWAVVRPEDRDAIRETGLARQRGEKVPDRYEVQIVTKSGRERWVDFAATRVQYEGRTVTLGTATDVTERKQAEAALRASEEKFRTVAETAPVGIFIYEGERFLYVNAMAEEVTGYSREELLRINPWTILHAEFHDLARKQETARLRGEFDVSRYELKIVRMDGAVRWLDCGAAWAEIGGRRVVMGSAADITERKQAQEALRESEERFRQFAENLEDVVWMSDAGKKAVLYVNAAYERVWGRPRQELYDGLASFLDVLHPDDLAIGRRMLERPAKESYEREAFRIIRPDGSIRWLRNRAFGIKDDHGKIQRVAGVVEDITRQRLAEEALHESEERLRTVVSAAPIALWATDANGIVTFSQGRGVEALGSEQGEHVGRCVFDTYRDSPDVVASHRRALAGEPSSHRYTMGDIMYESQVVPVRDADGNVTGAIGVGVDVSRRVRAEEALRESEEMYRALYENNPAMYFTVDAEGTVLSVNQFGAEQLGYAAGDLVGRPVMELVFEADRKAVERQLKRCLRNPDQVGSFEFRKICKGGGVVWVREIARAVAGPGGKRTLLLVCEDITVLKEMEQALQKTREELERKVERQMKVSNPYRLTFRELTVLHLIVRGKSDKEIATTLGISPLTAHKHVSRILKRMKAVSRTEAGVRAMRDGLVA